MSSGSNERMGTRQQRFFAAITACLAVAACSGSPAHPTGAGDLTGSWNGLASDSSGAGQMTWQIVQTGTSFSGTLTMVDGSTGLGGRGSVSGTASATAIHFAISVLAGGFDSPFNTCSASISGDGQASSSSITATYSGSNSCSDGVTSGQLTLSRQ